MFFVYILEFILQTKKNKINIIEYNNRIINKNKH